MRLPGLALFAAPLILASASAGCAGKKPVSVDGVVTLDGKPVPRAAVTFAPEGGGRPAVGVTGTDGSFELTTFTPGDGAPPGEYRVTVTGGSNDPGPAELSDPAQMKKLYLELTLHKGKRSAPKPKPIIPAAYGDAQSSPLRCRVPTDGTVYLKLKSTGGL